MRFALRRLRLKEKTIVSSVMFSYILREMLVYFAVAFCFFFFIFFVNQILLMAENILAKQVPFKDVALLILYSLPSVIATAAPFATLVGTLMCLGRMSGDNEILSLRALGFSFTTVLLPMLASGVVISLVSFFTNDILLPAGTIKFNRLYRQIIASAPALELESNSIKRSDDAAIVCGVVEDNDVDRLVIFDSDSDKNARVIVSSGASIKSAAFPGAAITLDMDDTDILILNKKNKTSYDYLEAKETVYNIFFSEFSGTMRTNVSPREMSSRDVKKEYDKKRRQYMELEYAYRADVFEALYTLEVKMNSYTPMSGFSADSEIKKAKNALNRFPSRFSLNNYRMEYNMKFSTPFGSLFFITISFPLGVLVKKRGQAAALFFGIFISFIYWALLITGQTMTIRSGFNGFAAMWGPNMLVAAAGIYLSIRVFRK